MKTNKTEVDAFKGRLIKKIEKAQDSLEKELEKGGLSGDEEREIEVEMEMYDLFAKLVQKTR